MWQHHCSGHSLFPNPNPNPTTILNVLYDFVDSTRSKQYRPLLFEAMYSMKANNYIIITMLKILSYNANENDFLGESVHYRRTFLLVN